MISVRCNQCGKELEVIEINKTNEYKERYSFQPCNTCLTIVNTSEQKILRAIMGERIA